MIYSKKDYTDFEEALKKEWLITNGIGGFASSTIIGANSRRYHGLLVASLEAPVKRHLVLSKIDEVVEVEGKDINLANNLGKDFIEDSREYLQSFSNEDFPTYTYNINGIIIEKKIFMVYKQNKVVLMYKVVTNNNPIKIKLKPLINFRDFHGESNRKFMNFDCEIENNSVKIIPYNQKENTIYIKSSNCKFKPLENCWYFNMKYSIEEERGLNCIEDHYIPGYFELCIGSNQSETITLVASMEDFEELNGEKMYKKELKRIEKLVETAGYTEEFANKLVKASDCFIVDRKSTKSKTIIAGYPWFSDWGRDTMIAFSGITLATKRYDDAKNILLTFSKYIKNGLLPNTFPNSDEEPFYNTVDASLWYFEAIYQYVKETKDYEFVRKNLYKGMKDIITRYILGADFGIKMDEDGLIIQGDKEHQLTWMDAKVNDYVVTPRYGKAVEINALWYNALKIMEYISNKIGENFDQKYSNAYNIVKKAFIETFWNLDDECLYDYVNEEGRNYQIRPNQVLALSLSFPVIEGEKAQKIINKVWKELYTDYGLRTLSKNDKEYKGVYKGDVYSRDTSYHQGTVWVWILGEFMMAYLKANEYSKESKETVKKMLEPFKSHIDDACIGSISEIFDGDMPFAPKGAFAQAWSVGEILRVYKEVYK